MTFAWTGWARIYLQTVTTQPGFHDIIHGIYTEKRIPISSRGAWKAVEEKLCVV
jgi:hypothetical protein